MKTPKTMHHLLQITVAFAECSETEKLRRDGPAWQKLEKAIEDARPLVAEYAELESRMAKLVG